MAISDPSRIAQVTLDGTECNKVGASFSAFRNQPSQCGVPQGSCLNNQLRDFLLADRARVASGQAPLYLASLYGAGSIRDPLPRAPQPGSKRLAFPITQLRNTVVQLTLSADSIRFVVNVSPGFIAAARLVDFSGRNASSFTALSGNGRVLVAVTNNGTLSAGYTVAIVNCTPGVSVFQSQGEVTVAPGATAEQVLTCAVEDDLAGRRSCVVTLRGAPSRGALLPPRAFPAAPIRAHLPQAAADCRPPPPCLPGAILCRLAIPAHRFERAPVLHKRNRLRLGAVPRAKRQRARRWEGAQKCRTHNLQPSSHRARAATIAA